MKFTGKFVVIDGGDGSGKTGTIKFLKEKFEGENVLFTREPGGTPCAEEIRSVLIQKGREEKMFAEAELMLFCAARLQHVGNVIIPARAKGTHVLCDRFSLSTLAYQLYGNGRLDLFEFFKMLNKIAVSGCDPSLYVLLDVSVEVALARRHRAGDINRFDQKKIEFHRAVREGFRDHIGSYENGAIVDASKSEEEVQLAVYNLVKNHLSL